MGHLTFVGLGLQPAQDLGPQTVEELRRCQRIFLEEYTSRSDGDAATEVERRTGRPTVRLGREDVEAEGRILEALGRGERVALLVVGDAFAATTHVSLRLSVAAHGHGWSYRPAASILTAAPGLLGLSPYRFGRVVSLPHPAPNFRPRSPYDLLTENFRAGLHTLVLLDLDPAADRYLLAGPALRHLGELEEELRGGTLPPERTVAVLARVGSPQAKVAVGTRAALEGGEYGPPLHCLVLPAADLHFLEKEALKAWAGPSGFRPQD